MPSVVPTTSISKKKLPEVKPIKSPTNLINYTRQKAKERWKEHNLNRHRTPYSSWDTVEEEQAEIY